MALRSSLEEHALDAYLVPSDDPHLSEYTPDAYKRRAFLTNFQGSAGTAVVTKSCALLWTDSRYVCFCVVVVGYENGTKRYGGENSGGLLLLYWYFGV